MATNPTPDFMSNTRLRRQRQETKTSMSVSFVNETDVCYLDEGAMLSPTSKYLERAKNWYMFEKVGLEDEIHDEYSYVNFVEDWNLEEESWFRHKRHHCEAVFDALVDYYMAMETLRGKTKVGSKIEKMKSSFMDFIEKEELYTRMKKFEIEIIFHQAVVCGDFETVRFILDIFKQWEFKGKTSSQSGTGGRGWRERVGVKIELHNFLNRVLLKYYQHLLLNGDNTAPAVEDEEERNEIEFYTYDEMRDSSWGGGLEYLEMKWCNYLEWLSTPKKLSDELKENWIEDYFFLVDAGLVRSMLNNVTDKATKEKMATKLINLGVHDFMKKQRLQRSGIDPIFLADKFISCRNRCSYECQRHPGYLLLLLIRLGHTEMVRLCLNHGMSPNLNIASGGQITELKWVDKQTFDNFGVDDEVEKLKNKKKRRHSKDRDGKNRMLVAEDVHEEFLNAVYEKVTPLSLALECAGYWKTTSIVELLLSQKANPLTCQDAAIRACTPALTLLSQKNKKRKKAIEIKCLQLIYKHIDENYENIADNHCTLSLLYQSAAEKNWNAVEYLTQHIDDPKGNKKGASSHLALGTYTNFDEEVFILIIQVIDHFLRDGKRKNGVGFSRSINSIVELTEMHELYLDNRRFELLFDILMSAVNADIPGDRVAILRLLQNSQMQHYLKLKMDKKWNKRKINQFMLNKRVKKQLSIEPRRGSISRIAFRRPSSNLQAEREMRSVQIEMLCILAAKTGFSGLLSFFFNDAISFKLSDQGIITMATSAVERFDRPLLNQIMTFGLPSGNLLEKLFPIVEAKDREERNIRIIIQKDPEVNKYYSKKKERMLKEPLPLVFVLDFISEMIRDKKYNPSEDSIVRMAAAALKNNHLQLVDQFFSLEEMHNKNLVEKIFDLVIQGNNPDALSIILELITDAQVVLYCMKALELKIEHILFNHKLVSSNDNDNIEEIETEWYKEDRLFRVAATYLFSHGKERQQRFLATLIEKAKSNTSEVWFLGLHSLLLTFTESHLLPLITKDFTETYFNSYQSWMVSDDQFEDAMHPLVDETLEKVFAILKDNEHIQALESKYDAYMTELREHEEMEEKALQEEARSSVSSGGSFYERLQKELESHEDIGTSSML